MNRPSAFGNGFTLLELVVILAIIGILAAIALPVYRGYVERAQLSQLLLQIDHIGTAVQVESATGRHNLHQDAQPGRSPPRLGTVPDIEFNEPGGLRLLLIRAPAGFFGSWPNEPHYGLIADLTGKATVQRLRYLYRELPYGAGDKIWVAENQLAFPIHGGATSAQGQVPPAPPPPPPPPVTPPSPPVPPPPPPAKPDTGWEGEAVVDATGGWSCKGSFTAYGTDGKPLTGVNAAIQIKVVMTVTTWDGKVIEREYPGNHMGNLTDGKASFQYGGLSNDAGRGEVVSSCHLEVVGITYYYPTNPAIPWDGNTSSIDIAPPPAGAKR